MRISKNILTGAFLLLFALNCQGQESRAEHPVDTTKTGQVRFILAEGAYVGVDKRILRSRPTLNVQSSKLKEPIARERRKKIEDGGDVTVGSAYRLMRAAKPSSPNIQKGEKGNDDQPKRYILQQGMDVGVGPRTKKTNKDQ